MCINLVPLWCILVDFVRTKTLWKSICIFVNIKSQSWLPCVVSSHSLINREPKCLCMRKQMTMTNKITTLCQLEDCRWVMFDKHDVSWCLFLTSNRKQYCNRLEWIDIWWPPSSVSLWGIVMRQSTTTIDC